MNGKQRGRGGGGGERGGGGGAALLLGDNPAQRPQAVCPLGVFGSQVFNQHSNTARRLHPPNTNMKGKEKQGQELAASKKTKIEASSSEEEDSDVERNFALLTKRGEEEEEEQNAEEDISDDDDDDDEGSDSGEDEEEEEEGSDVGEEEDEDSEASEEEEEEDEEPEAAGGSGEIETREDIKNELSNMSFEEIMKLQNKVGTKVYNEVAYGSSRRVENGKKKRLNKNRPMEISAKRPAPFLRQVVSVKKPMSRDPRFDDLSGEYKPEIFEKTYRFINDIKQGEKEIIQKTLKKTKSNTKAEKLQFLLKRMENQERARKSREEQRERELQFKREQRERANQGARPFFLKNSDKKKLQLAEKYQELKKSGKLENFLSKKRKRNAGKDRRKLPKQLQNQQTA
ncbi:ribosomal RNA processing protein 36 homolog isoform X1 [Labrus mixtus]|uniref:ribosomal RNA processing protein 36 homolog isoform X1 n=2 Tax=Labrus mixtus TaxID=508554 RepID=UPI0029C03FF6|nr:ribosomal RNA processing protein 36 homolog isoform X1 [Labrus mixtus]